MISVWFVFDRTRVCTYKSVPTSLYGRVCTYKSAGTSGQDGQIANSFQIIVGMALAPGWDRDLGTGWANSEFLSNDCRNGARAGLGQGPRDRTGQ